MQLIPLMQLIHSTRTNAYLILFKVIFNSWILRLQENTITLESLYLNIPLAIQCLEIYFQSGIAIYLFTHALIEKLLYIL